MRRAGCRQRRGTLEPTRRQPGWSIGPSSWLRGLSTRATLMRRPARGAARTMKPISAATPSRTLLEAPPLALEEPAAVRGRGKPSGASGSRARWPRAACGRERAAGRACLAWSTVAVIRADVRPGRSAVAVGGDAWRAERRGVPNGDGGDANARSPSSTVEIGIPATAGVGSTTGDITTEISTSAGSSGVGGSARAAVTTPGSGNVMTGRNDSSGG
jgi:hypothetical protein